MLLKIFYADNSHIHKTNRLVSAPSIHLSAAVVVNDFSTVGISAGNTSRKRAVRYALQDAGEYFENNQNNNLICKDRNSEILISDSVIYFDEYAKKLADVGIKAIIQTGGVECDAEFIQYCNDHDISMIFTGIQHLSV